MIRKLKRERNLVFCRVKYLVKKKKKKKDLALAGLELTTLTSKSPPPLYRRWSYAFVAILIPQNSFLYKIDSITGLCLIECELSKT